MKKEMKKLILSFALMLLAMLSFAATKITFQNGISLEFEACTDGSVHFTAEADKPRNPAKDFELRRNVAGTQFVQNTDGSFSWEKYSILLEESGYTLFFDGKALYTSVFSTEKNLLKELREWKTAKEFYGFGEAPTSVNLSNQSLTIYNESKYGNHAFLFVPYYFTNEYTSVYYNANGKDKIYFQDGPDKELYRTEYRRIDCFVRQDASANECVTKFYLETQTRCLLPKWTYGYIQSKYGYKSADEVIELSEKFKEHAIPLSAVVLDLYWFNKMGDIFWTAESFSNYKEMDEVLEANGTKLITITEPFYCSDSDNFNELKRKGLLCKNEKGKICLWREWWCQDSKDGGMFNPFAKNASKFLGEKYAKMLDSGIDGFWTDLGEPEGAWNVKGLKIGKWAEQDVHNYYNYYWSKALYEGVHSIYPDRRLFIMSRSGYTGIGKFNVSVWSGDVSVSWPSLSKNVAWGVNANLVALPYWGSDVGGFTPEKSPEELYIRWQQFGAFTPIYRAHGTGEREPFAYSEKAEKIVAELIRQRERLVPYIYSTARQTMSGKPMMRAMFLEDADTPSSFNNTQFMFGDWILVSPITKDELTEKEHTTYLPKGAWYDLHSLELAESSGEKVVTTKNTIEKIPVYVKEGAIIPYVNPAKDGKEEENGILLIPSKNGESNFTLYNDDGVTEQYRSGNYSELSLTLKSEGGKTTLKGEISGNKDFLSENYTISLPKKVPAEGNWASGAKTKSKTFSLNEILEGISF